MEFRSVRAAARWSAAWFRTRWESPRSIPIEHQLLFERWLNPGRKSMPDIDVDFCFERRDEVLDYVRKKYGDDRVAQIITFGTIKGKQAIRDVGRVLGTVVRRDRQNRQAVSGAQAGPRFPARRRARDGAAAQGRAQTASRSFRLRVQARGPAAPRLAPCGGRRHFRSAAQRPGAAVRGQGTRRSGAGDHAVFDEGRRGNRARSSSTSSRSRT